MWQMVPTSDNNVVAQQNDQALCVSNENYRNPLIEAKHQRELLKDYFNHMGEIAGQGDRI